MQFYSRFSFSHIHTQIANKKIHLDIVKNVEIVQRRELQMHIGGVKLFPMNKGFSYEWCRPRMGRKEA